MNRTNLIISGIAALGLTMAASQSEAQARPHGAPGQAQQHERMHPPGHARHHQAQQPQAEQVIQEWLPEAQEAAQKMIDQYGAPDEVTQQRVIWHNNGPWKRTEVVNEEIPHNFPMPHNDMLYQTVNYEVPVEKASELLEMTGSLIIDRVKGELTARCDDEAPNFLSINLAHQIVEGDITAEEGRERYALAMQDQQHMELKEELVFTPPQEPQNDPGIQFGGREHRQEEEKDKQP